MTQQSVTLHGAMARIRRRCDASTGRAFTLLELMLVIILLAVLAAMAWPNLSGRLAGKELIHSARRLAGTLQLCRASAMAEAKRYRCIWDAETDELVVQIERDPFEHPGEFTDLKAHWARSNPLVGKVRCVDVRIKGWAAQTTEELNELTMGELSSEQRALKYEPLVFQVNGTCEPAAIILEDGSGRRKVLQINRLTGQATIRDPRGDELPEDAEPTERIEEIEGGEES